MKPGVYINLPFPEYIKQDALGQSDLKVLLRTPADWWYNSKNNSDRIEPKREKHFILGDALHVTLLETAEEYEKRFSVEPDKRDYPDAATTIADIKGLLDDAEVAYEKGWKKDELVTAADDAGLGDKVWDCIRAKHLADVKAGKHPISAADDRALRHMGQIARDHPQIGPGLKMAVSEVSVFWEEDGIMRRARFDKIAPHWSMDLKSFSGWQGRDPRRTAIRQIVEHEYDIQATWYQDAREKFREFVQANKVFMCLEDEGKVEIVAGLEALPTQEDANKLIEIASADSWTWLWLFYQLRDDTGSKPKAPALIPKFYRPSNLEEQRAAIEENSFDMMSHARKKIDRALENFRAYRDQVGFETPWTDIDPIRELTDEDLAAAGLAYKGVPE